MKLLTIILLIIILYKSDDNCIKDDFCVDMVDFLSFIPAKDEHGNRDITKEQYKIRRFLYFETKLVVYNIDDSSNVDDIKIVDSDRHLIRLLYSQIILECGGDMNRICTLPEFLKLHPDYKLPVPQVTSIDSYESLLNLCFVFSYVDNTARSASESTVLVCEKNKNLLEKFYKFFYWNGT